MTTAAIIQARTGSTRLPGKVLRPLAGRPMLAHVIRRAGRARGVDRVVVATTVDPRDDAVADLARTEGAEVFRGSEADVLDRYARAAEKAQADLVVRITSDCPLVDPGLLDEMLARRAALAAETGEIDHYSNVVHRTYPRGYDVEIVPAARLAEQARSAADPRAREHVTWGIWSASDRYRVVSHVQPNGRDDSALRLTVDVEADFDLISRILGELGPAAETAGLAEVLAVLARRPEWSLLNAHVEQKAL